MQKNDNMSMSPKYIIGREGVKAAGKARIWIVEDRANLQEKQVL